METKRYVFFALLPHPQLAHLRMLLGSYRGMEPRAQGQGGQLLRHSHGIADQVWLSPFPVCTRVQYSLCCPERGESSQL